VRLYYGTRSEEATPFAEDAAAWEGVKIINVYSSAGEGYVQASVMHTDADTSTKSFDDRQPFPRSPHVSNLNKKGQDRGWRASSCVISMRRCQIDRCWWIAVQDVFSRDGAVADGAKTGVVLCGQKQMCEQITQILVERGVSTDNILTNF